jgi:hypothetical protein
MALFSVAFDGTRVNNADALTGWTADGVTPALNLDNYYQGTGSIAAQVKTADAGFQFTSGAQNMSGTSRAVLIKMASGRPGALQGNGISCRIGSTTANYYLYSLFSAATYPAVGGFQIVAVDPNVAQWRSATVGTPNLASVTYWSFRAHYTANTQGANTFADSIDTIARGTGLTGTAGGNGDPVGNFASFVTADEATEANRWGVVTSRDGILFVNGTIVIGTSATATNFTSSGEAVVFPNNRVTTNFCGVVFDIQNAGTNIDVSGGLFNGRGALFTNDDTRPRYTVLGTAGICTIDAQTFSGYEQVILTSKPVLTGCSFDKGLLISPNGASMTGCSITNSTGTHAVNVTSIAHMASLSACTFSSNNRAIRLTTAGTYTFDGHQFSGNTYDVENASTGLITINATNNSNVATFINTNGGSTVIVNAKTFIVTNIIENSEVRILRQSDNVELGGVENVASTPTDPVNVSVSADPDNAGRFRVSYTYGYTADIPIWVVVFNVEYQPIFQNATLRATDGSLLVTQIGDRQYDRGTTFTPG